MDRHSARIYDSSAMPWYKKVLKKNKKEIISSAILLTVFALAVSLWHFLLGKSFEWQDISPIDEPGLVPRIFYSALVFIGPGWFLYHKVKLWKFLYEPYRGGGRRAYREYQKLKNAIWGLLILLMFFVIVPLVVNILNAIISFFYNILNLILYIAPPLGISLIVFAISLYLYGQLKPKA